MTLPFCENKSPRRLCEEIEKVIPPTGRIVRRPYNHYVPTFTDWWMVPSLALPFFKFGKYFFSWDETKRDSIRAGYHLTKGLDPALKAVYPSRRGKRLLMDATWGWHTFYPATQDGTLERLLREVAAADRTPVQLIFDGGYIDDPDLFEPEMEQRKRDRYTLVFDPAADTVKVANAKRDAMCLKLLNKVRDFSSLRTAFAELNAESFLWCDLFIAVPYAVCEYGEYPAGATVRTAAEIYQHTLAPFRELVR